MQTIFVKKSDAKERHAVELKDTNSARNSETIIKITNNYTIFHFLDGNRQVKPAHVRALMESLTKHPNLRPARPILVNENMQVIDGQHRLEASKRLGIDVYFTIVPGLTIEDARVINALQRSWTLLEYGESFALSGYEPYKFFMEMHESFPIPASAMIVFMTNGNRSNQAPAFRHGQFKPDSRETVLARLYKLEDFKANLPKAWTEQAFALAVAHLLKHPDYNHERMLKKMQNVQLVRASDRAEYLRQMEEVFNIGNSKRTRFF